MPTHTAASALICFHSFDGAPWCWPRWQEITGVKHGLFPTDDLLLPKGWTRRDAEDIKSYFFQYHQLPPEDKIKFSVNSSSGPVVPGRSKWNNWVNGNWAKWGIHNRIVTILHEQGCHPLTITATEGSGDVWPDAGTYIPIVLDAVAMELFGEEAFPVYSDRLTFILRRPTTSIIQRSWATIRVRFNRDKMRLPEIEQAALEAFNSMSTCYLSSTYLSK